MGAVPRRRQEDDLRAKEHDTESVQEAKVEEEARYNN